MQKRLLCRIAVPFNRLAFNIRFAEPCQMIAIGILAAFLLVMAIFNMIDFGRID